MNGRFFSYWLYEEGSALKNKRFLILVLLLLYMMSASGCTKFLQAVSYREREIPVPILDPGHGGDDGGAVSPGGDKESIINLSISKEIEQIFAIFGVKCVKTRDSEDIIYSKDADTIRKRKVYDQHTRLNLIDSVENGFLISIHQNFYPSAEPHGAEIYYNAYPSAENLAKIAQESLITELDPTNKRTAAKVSDSVFLTNHVSCPAILVECGFLSNPEELQNLLNPTYQCKIAMLLSAAFLNYCDNTG